MCMDQTLYLSENILLQHISYVKYEPKEDYLKIHGHDSGVLFRILFFSGNLNKTDKYDVIWDPYDTKAITLKYLFLVWVSIRSKYT